MVKTLMDEIEVVGGSIRIRTWCWINELIENEYDDKIKVNSIGNIELEGD